MAEDRAPVTQPEPFLKGTFAMYATSKGDVVLATTTNLMGDKVTRVPRIVVKQAARGNPLLAEILEKAKKTEE